MNNTNIASFLATAEGLVGQSQMVPVLASPERPTDVAAKAMSRVTDRVEAARLARAFRAEAGKANGLALDHPARERRMAAYTALSAAAWHRHDVLAGCDGFFSRVLPHREETMRMILEEDRESALGRAIGQPIASGLDALGSRFEAGCEKIGAGVAAQAAATQAAESRAAAAEARLAAFEHQAQLAAVSARADRAEAALAAALKAQAQAAPAPATPATPATPAPAAPETNKATRVKSQVRRLKAA